MDTFALGRQRFLERFSGYRRQREDYRQRRMGGGERPSAADAPGSRLDRFRAETQAKKDREMMDPKTAAMEAKKREQEMMDAANSASPGATRESDLAAIRTDIAAMRKHVESIEKRVPEGTT
jgi:hypothetical protein